MGMNIKSERVHALAREAAQVTNQSLTSAVEEALLLLLRERGSGVDPEVRRRIDLVRPVIEAYRLDPGRDDREILTAEDLYDEATGMPR
ncbi:MAG: type II toxin-antitoxin system VapB family antitoxin [Actinomycetia bacterium]|nr:type II toxin-antitoxin system VapB family antitoxin [Actinomycetes bacterium]